jgi:antagonist of KipI
LSIVESDGTAREASMSTAVAMPAGARLRVQERRAGARAYLAVDGGFAVPTVLGSRATHLVARMGGIEGRALRSGDVLPLGRRRSVRPRASPPGMDLPVGGARLRVLPGPDDAWFDEAAIERLVTGRFVISAASNRMGFRLDGPPLAWQSSVEFISDAATMGHIQVPPSGDPILLMADRATAGGYPKIATVISADLPLAGQLAPGDWIEFVRCDRGEAIRALIRQEQRLLSWV